MRLTVRGRRLAALTGTSALLLGLGSIASVMRAGGESGARSDAETIASIRAHTALLDLRRGPEIARSAVARRRLDRILAETIEGTESCVVAQVDGETIGRIAPATALAPASTMKIITAYAILERRGPAFRFTTTLRGPPVGTDGVIRGDVFFVGGGDPTLATPRYEEYVRATPRSAEDPLTPLQQVVDALVERGVRRIDGAIVGDGSRYEGPEFLDTWKPNYRDEGQVGPIGALTVNHGFADFPPPVPVDDAPTYAAGQLTVLMQRAGIEVGGAPRAGAAPDPAPRALATIESPALRDIVAGMLTSSDNTTAEMLLREVALTAGEPPSTAAGVDAALDTIQRAGIRVDGATPLDGSGLSPDSRLSCATLIDALNRRVPAIDRGLADAAMSGTLVDRFVATPFSGVLHAKTGQLAGVAGLAGFLDPVRGRREIRFAFLARGDFTSDGGQALQAAIVDAIARYPDAPPTDTLIPAPR